MAASPFLLSATIDARIAQAYRIDGNQVEFQATVDVSTQNLGIGPVGVAVWPQKELAFFTYEGSPMIVWSSTKTLEKVSEFNTGVNDLAGIVVDTGNEKIYVVKRQSANLRIYSWSVPNATLVLDSVQVLQGLEFPSPGAFGVALDEPNNRLYVSDNTATVRYYNTTTWAYQGSIDIEVNETSREAVGIAVDPTRGCLYTGYFNGGGGNGYNSLVRTNLTTQVSIETDIGWPVIGIDVDKDTGFVYCTTHVSDFRVYDSNLVLLDTETNGGIESPAGVAVGGWYKTPSLTLVKDNNDSNNNCVWPWNEVEENCLVFDISWDSNGFSDTNVVVIEQLPQELDYDSSIPEGDYNEFDKTVKWNIGNISAGASGCVVLKTKVNEWARPCGTITNTAIMEGDTYLNEADCNVNVCPWGGEIIYVDKDANGFNNGTDWQNAYKDLQDALTQAKSNCAAITAIWVSAGTYKPVGSIYEENYQNKSFELIDGVGLIGHFAGNESSTAERNFADANNETVLEGQIGQYYYNAVYKVVIAANINSAMVDGFTIKGSYSYGGIYLDNSDISIVNCKFKNNNSSGLYAYNYSYPDIHNCLFMDNADYSVYAAASQPNISYCVFDGNNTTSYGLYLDNYSVSNITNSDFVNHNASAIEGSYATIDIEGCNLSQNGYYGVEGSGLNLTVMQTIFEDNVQNGIRLSSGSDLDIRNSVIRNSGSQGIYLSQCSSTQIINNWIHNNGKSSSAAGTYFENQGMIPFIRNNTIYDNGSYGIEVSQTGADPNISNCIISGNDTNDLYRPSGIFNKVKYCLLQNTHSGTGNRTGDPCFRNPSDPNDLHISVDS